MRNAGLDESQARIKTAGRNISNLRYTDDRKRRGTKEPLDEGERGEQKNWLKNSAFKKQGNSRKTSTPVSLTMLKPLTVWITTNCGKFLKR